MQMVKQRLCSRRQLAAAGPYFHQLKVLTDWQ